MERTLSGQPIELPTKEDAAWECANYVLEHEREDFWENPDRFHIYFYALVFNHGIDHAMSTLKQALKEK